MAAGDLTTLESARAWLGISGVEDDVLLSRLITSISAYIKTWLNRQIITGVVTEVRDGTGSSRISLRENPVSAVSSVTIEGAVIPASAGWNSPGYSFDSRGITLNGYSFGSGKSSVQITYTAGYSDAPPDIEQACLEMVALRYRERDRIGHSSKSVNGESTSFIVSDMPASAKTLLKAYKRVVPV